MDGQAIIKPQSLTAKMDAGYPKGVKGGNSSITTVDTSTDTTIITEQVRASVIINENITLSGLQTQDGVNLTERETVVVNGQTDKKENGIYLVQSGAWTRHSQKLYGGLTISITSGKKYADTFWLVSEPDFDATLGTDRIKFIEVADKGSPLQYTEIAELAQQQDDTLFERLINNNVNLRYTNVSGTAGAIPGNPSPNKTFLVFDHKDFNGGGMEQEQNQMYFRSNKCGVYRVSFGMLFDITAGADTVDFAVILERKRPSTGGSTSSNPYSCVFWQAVGTLNKFWANGSDLIELEEGDSVGISMHNGAAGGISAGNYTLTAWIAINYTGNQH